MVSWPWIFISSQIGYSKSVRITPAARQVAKNVPRLSRVSWHYTLENTSSSPLRIEVIAKSCQCLEVQMDSNSIAIGASLDIVISSDMPREGNGWGQVLVGVMGTDNERVLLSFDATPESIDGLRIAPESVLLSEDNWNRGAIIDISLIATSPDSAIPGNVHLEGEMLEIKNETNWEQVESGVYRKRLAVQFVGCDSRRSQGVGALDETCGAVSCSAGACQLRISRYGSK